jgi:hypothetical protein
MDYRFRNETRTDIGIKMIFCREVKEELFVDYRGRIDYMRKENELWIDWDIPALSSFSKST